MKKRIHQNLLLKSIFDLSDVDIVERSKYDMSFKYFLDMAPEDEVIHPSSLTKFRKLRLQDVGLLDMLIDKTVGIALEKGLIKSKTIIVDATHTKSRYNQKSGKEFLMEKSKNFQLKRLLTKFKMSWTIVKKSLRLSKKKHILPTFQLFKKN